MEWISVKDKLPNENKIEVLVYVEYIGVEVNYCLDGIFVSQYAHQITHWMPLPKPPKDTQ